MNRLVAPKKRRLVVVLGFAGLSGLLMALISLGETQPGYVLQIGLSVLSVAVSGALIILVVLSRFDLVRRLMPIQLLAAGAAAAALVIPTFSQDPHSYGPAALFALPAPVALTFGAAWLSPSETGRTSDLWPLYQTCLFALFAAFALHYFGANGLAQSVLGFDRPSPFSSLGAIPLLRWSSVVIFVLLWILVGSFLVFRRRPPESSAGPRSWRLAPTWAKGFIVVDVLALWLALTIVLRAFLTDSWLTAVSLSFYPRPLELAIMLLTGFMVIFGTVGNWRLARGDSRGASSAIMGGGAAIASSILWLVVGSSLAGPAGIVFSLSPVRILYNGIYVSAVWRFRSVLLAGPDSG